MKYSWGKKNPLIDQASIANNQFTGNIGAEEHAKWHYGDTFNKIQTVENSTEQMTSFLQQINCRKERYWGWDGQGLD